MPDGTQVQFPGFKRGSIDNEIVHPDLYASEEIHGVYQRLRREDPLHWTQPDGFRPFWAVTKHADVITISRQPKLFLNAPRLAVFPDIPEMNPEDRPARHLLNMDPPDHAKFRKLASARFTPRAVQSLRPSIERIADDLLDKMSSFEQIETLLYERALGRSRGNVSAAARLLNLSRAQVEYRLSKRTRSE